MSICTCVSRENSIYLLSTGADPGKLPTSKDDPHFWINLEELLEKISKRRDNKKLLILDIAKPLGSPTARHRHR